MVACEIGGYISTEHGGRTYVVFDWTIDNLGSADLFYASSVGGQYAYDCHPVFAQALYRYQPEDADGIYAGRFEQIGTSWLKHGTAAPQQDPCLGLGSCSNTGPYVVNINCSDTYSASAENVSPYALGPKSDLNPETGLLRSIEFTHPVKYPNDVKGGQITLQQVEIYEPLDPHAQDWAFYLEHQGFAADEESANRANNYMFKNVPTDWTVSPAVGFQVGDSSPNNPLWSAAAEVKGLPAIYAWKNLHDPLVTIKQSLGWAFGYRTTKTGTSTWHYEYAVMNLESASGAWAFEVPVGSATITSDEFNDVDPTSGEACTCNGTLLFGFCQEKDDCDPGVKCRSAKATCTNNIKCVNDDVCVALNSQWSCGDSGMCTDGATCDETDPCASGFTCLTSDYCIRNADWVFAVMGSPAGIAEWKTDESFDTTDTSMVIRPNMLEWGEMNTFRFVANAAPQLTTAILRLRNGTTVSVLLEGPGTP